MKAHAPPVVSCRSDLKRVLVVDDNAMVRELLGEFLHSWGYATYAASCLLAACRAVVTEGPFDLIICSYELPDGNAYNLFTWMREQSVDVPAIVSFGALPPVDDPPDGVELLAKPFDPVKLQELIHEVTRTASRRPRAPRSAGHAHAAL